ncbi:MAG: hypothetical protein ACRD3J_18190, partial [Thermoanaerobaculia bacterium]
MVGSTTPNYPESLPGSGVLESIVFRIDSTGSIVWSGTLRSANFAEQPILLAIKPTPDGKYLIAANREVITLAGTGSIESQMLLQGETPGDVVIEDVVATADGFFASGFGPRGSLLARFVGTSVAWSYGYEGLSFSVGTFLSLQFSPDQALIAQTGGQPGSIWKVRLDGTVQWAVAKYGQELAAVDASGRVSWGAIGLSADGQPFAGLYNDDNAPQSIVATSDGGFAVAGSSLLGDGEVFVTKHDPSQPGCLRDFPFDPESDVFDAIGAPSLIPEPFAVLPSSIQFLPLTVVQS